MQLQLNILPPLNWLDFRFKVVLYCYVIMRMFNDIHYAMNYMHLQNY